MCIESVYSGGLAQREIRCGEAANFQGDERDVIVLTTVVALDPNSPSTRFSPMTRTAPMRGINVAASRARNQMWVVASVDPQDLPAGDLRAELIRHCTAPPTVEERRRDLLDGCESDFERRVVNSLQARGYRAIEVQHQVGQYRLDIVVAGSNGRLAIECDGDRWHGEDVWCRDRPRQQVLERPGWTSNGSGAPRSTATRTRRCGQCGDISTIWGSPRGRMDGYHPARSHS